MADFQLFRVVLHRRCGSSPRYLSTIASDLEVRALDRVATNGREERRTDLLGLIRTPAAPVGGLADDALEVESYKESHRVAVTAVKRLQSTRI